MKKSFKKALSLTLATSMAFALPISVSADDELAKVTLPSSGLLYAFDFADGSLANKGTVGGTAAIVGGGSITDGYFDNASTAELATKRVNYMSLPNASAVAKDINTSANKGLTFSTKIKLVAGKYAEWSPIFVMDSTSNPASWPVFAAELRGTAAWNSAGYFNGDNTNMNTVLGGLSTEKWATLTIVANGNEGETGKIYTYVDGTLISFTDIQAFSGDDNSILGILGAGSDTFFQEVDTAMLGGGQPYDWNDPDAQILYDDVLLYDSALTSNQVRLLAEAGDPVNAAVAYTKDSNAYTTEEQEAMTNAETVIANIISNPTDTDDVVSVSSDMTSLDDSVSAGNFWTDFSDYYQFTGDFTARFSVTVDSKLANNVWNGPLVAVTNAYERVDSSYYTEYLRMRIDNYGWTNSNPGTVKIADTATFMTGMNGLEDNGFSTSDSSNDAVACSDISGTFDEGDVIEYVISRAGDKVKVMEILTDGTNKYNQWAIVDYTDTTLQIYFSTDQCGFTVNSIEYSAESDITGYRGTDAGNHETSTYTAPTKSGYIFAGWYSDSNYETPIASTTTTGTAYPKFVSNSLLTVKGQLAADTTTESATTSLRVFTAVDSLNYQKVILNISYTLSGTDTAKNKSVTLTTAYASVKSWTGTADEVLSAASVFGSSDAAYLLPLKLTNIKNADFNTDFTFTPSYVTTDGTIVTGSARTIKISEVLAA